MINDRIKLSLLGGISISMFPLLVNVLASHFGNTQVMNTSFDITFWSLSIFWYLDDTITGSRSYWMPSFVALLLPLVVNALICSTFVYAILYCKAKQKREA
jgi:hypothetical protein